MALTDLAATTGRADQARLEDRVGADNLRDGPAAHVRLHSPSHERALPIVGMLSFTGAGLLLVSELTDRLERIEGDVGMGTFNLIVAVLLAVPVVCTVALVGDSILARLERHSGHRPGAWMITPLLTVAGVTAAGGVIVGHLWRPPPLDAWIGIAGGVLLLLAGLARRHRSDEAQPRHRGR
jgi:hypothetical protein